MSRRFDDNVALQDVSLGVRRGTVHALLGPNGAGKTTLLRILSGLTSPSSGEVSFHVHGTRHEGGWQARRFVGIVPSGDRSFYLRLSGRENLAFFARLYGLGRRDALARADEMIAQVGLAGAAGRRVGLYSQGMKRRLTMARALLVDPPLLLVDEATHDLDPDGARVVRRLVRERTAAGSTVVWATQRLDELRGFADRLTVLDHGRVAYDGSVDAFATLADARSFILHVRTTSPSTTSTATASLLDDVATVRPLDTPDHLLVVVHEDRVLGDVVARLATAGVDVLSCREDESLLERAFLQLTSNEDAR